MVSSFNLLENFVKDAAHLTGAACVATDTDFGLLSQESYVGLMEIKLGFFLVVGHCSYLFSYSMALRFL